MPTLEYPTYLDHLRRASSRFREVLTDCDPAARVPACPDWDADDLLWHLAEVQWFWATTIRVRPGTVESAAVERPRRPDDHAELLDTFDDFSHALATELERAEPGETAWHWAPEQTVATSYRRQAHEALVHRVDAEQTAGVDLQPIDPALAADGVLELFEVMYGGQPPAWASFASAGRFVAVELDDVGQTLWVEPGELHGVDPDSDRSVDGPHLLSVADPGVPADATVRGNAADLDLWLWRRRDDSDIEVTGDRAVYDLFREAVAPPLD